MNTLLRSILLVSLSISCLSSCVQPSHSEQVQRDPLVHVESPAQPMSAEPKLVKSTSDQIFLSWIQRNADDSATLQTSQFIADQWNSPISIASGANWFVNWADFPTLAVHGTQQFSASFLKRNGQNKYAYDIQITTSEDNAVTWRDPFLLHKDGTQSEHGFVSLLPWQSDHFFALWLDGRKTGLGEHGRGSMSLRSAFYNLKGEIRDEIELDNRTCDCCQTAAAITGPGSLIVAYRDRSENEVRDIATIRYEENQWSEPAIVHDDHWIIPGCPVNGPAIDSKDGQVFLAWFTAANDTPQISLALSRDRGKSFEAPVQIDNGNPVGRVGVSMLDGKSALVSWVEKIEDAAELRMRHVSINTNEISISDPFSITEISPSRSSGFPQVIANNEFVVFAWTEVVKDSQTHVRTAFMDRSRLNSMFD